MYYYYYQARVEWSWVKAHNRTLLNECADTLATKGVMNEPRSSTSQFVRELGEDTDTQEYSMRDGEETQLMGGRGDKLKPKTQGQSSQRESKPPQFYVVWWP
jgi:hypothetical protein